MPVEHEREGTTCELCGNGDTKCTLSEKFDVIGKILLCDKCVKKDKENRETKCKKCDGLVWENGGLRKHNGEKYCLHCYDKLQDKLFLKEKRKDFFKDNWKFWILIGIALIGLAYTLGK